MFNKNGFSEYISEIGPYFRVYLLSSFVLGTSWHTNLNKDWVITETQSHVCLNSCMFC